MHTLLERRNQSLMISLDSAFFWISKMGKRLQAVGIEVNKVVISREMIFDEKVML